MLINIIERVYVFLKKESITIDQKISNSDLVSLLFDQLVGRIRGLFFCHFAYARKFVFVGPRVRLRSIRNIFLGKNVVLGENVFIDGLGHNGVHLGNDCSIGAYSRLIVGRNYRSLGNGINIGDNVGIGEFAYIGGAGKVNIGKGCIIGQYFSVHPENHNFSDSESEIRLQGTSRKGITIGDNCWIGSKVTILDGAVIGSGCVIAAGAVVKENFADNLVIGGVPAKILKNRY
ncbi:acyltransferase [Gammaproteobacteria bacterium]|nr:acyltransferase [Gammaproteobacteria bacterium]